MSRALRDRYVQHHRDGRRYGNTFGGVQRLSFFSEALASATRILDLGCRDGTLVSRLGLHDRAVFGLDIDSVALHRAASGRQLRVAQADLWSGMPIRSNSVDAVIAGEFLEHCPDPWAVAIEVSRVLADGGVFVGSVPNATRLKNRVRFALGRPVETDRTHLHSFSAATLRECLSSAGFAVTIGYVESRFLMVHPPLMANSIVFRATRGPTEADRDRPPRHR